MSDSVTSKILIFTTSQEKNGTAKLRDTIESEIPELFEASRSYKGFLRKIFFHRKSIRAIFALSSIHFLLALYFTKLLKMNIPVVLGMYHPNQWKIYLDDQQVSKTRAAVFLRLTGILTHDNIIHSSREGVESTEYYCKNAVKGTPTILQGPAEILHLKKEFREDRAQPVKIVTIGRLVDFKVSTIKAMIKVVEELVLNQDVNITYDVYGNGPSSETLNDHIQQSPVADRITLHHSISPELYADEVIKYDLFFGMAGALILAASAGVPSLIAIQEEDRPVSYGFFNAYNQEENPIFGDKSRFAKEYSLKESIQSFAALTAKQKSTLGKDCALQTVSYSTGSTKERLTAKILSAPLLKNFKVSAFEIAKIFFEVKISQRKGIGDMHT